MSQVFEGSLNGGQMRQLPISSLIQPVSLAIDWVGRNLYILDVRARRIDLYSLQHNIQHNIISYMIQPSDLTLDPTQGLVIVIQADRQAEGRPTIGLVLC